MTVQQSHPTPRLVASPCLWPLWNWSWPADLQHPQGWPGHAQTNLWGVMCSVTMLREVRGLAVAQVLLYYSLNQCLNLFLYHVITSHCLCGKNLWSSSTCYESGPYDGPIWYNLQHLEELYNKYQEDVSGYDRHFYTKSPLKSLAWQPSHSYHFSNAEQKHNCITLHCFLEKHRVVVTITRFKSCNYTDANKLYVYACFIRKAGGLDLSPDHLVVLIVPLCECFAEYDCVDFGVTKHTWCVLIKSISGN